jgi:hypothetical protein
MGARRMKLRDIIEWSGRWSTPSDYGGKRTVADGVLVESLLAELVKFWLRILKCAVHFGRGSTEAGTQM